MKAGAAEYLARQLRLERENRVRLKGCPGPHQFEPVSEDQRECTWHEYRCRICQGHATSAEREWYEHGRQTRPRGQSPVVTAVLSQWPLALMVLCGVVASATLGFGACLLLCRRGWLD